MDEITCEIDFNFKHTDKTRTHCGRINCMIECICENRQLRSDTRKFEYNDGSLSLYDDKNIYYDDSLDLILPKIKT